MKLCVSDCHKANIGKVGFSYQHYPFKEIKIKILAITDSHPPYHRGGYELRCKAVLDALQERGHNIQVLTTRRPVGKTLRLVEESVYRVLHRAQRTRGVLRGILDEYLDVRQLDKHVRLFRPDIVYLGHVLDLSRAIFPYLAEANIPVVIDDGGITVSWVYTHQGPWYGFTGYRSASNFKNQAKRLIRDGVIQLSRHRLKRAWAWPDNINAFFNNPAALNRALAKNAPLRNARVIRSGIDTELFSFSEHVSQDGEIEILTPGRIEPQKGTIDAVLLLNCVRQENIEAKLTIVGSPHYSSSYYADLMKLVNALGLQKGVTLVSQVEYHQMPAYYQRAEFCFFPSYHKTGLSRVPLEAMACGSLVIAYGNESSRLVIHNDNTGFIILEGEIQTAAKIVSNLVKSPETRHKVVRNARQVIEQHHSMDRYVDEIEAFLFDVLQ